MCVSQSRIVDLRVLDFLKKAGQQTETARRSVA
jgi:hypothetical protein